MTRCIIDELLSSDIQGDQMEAESGVTRNIIDDLHSPDIQGDQMEGESFFSRSIIDGLHSSISKEIKWKVKMVYWKYH